MEFEQYSRQVEQLASGCRQSGTDLAGAVQQARRKALSAIAAKEKATEKTELQQAAQNAKALAAKFQKERELQQTGAAFFRVDSSKLQAVRIFSNSREFTAHANDPCVFNQPCDGSSLVEVLLGSGTFGAAFTKFASKYKTQDGFKTDGRSRKFITEALGRDDVMKFFSSLEPDNALDISSIKGGSNFMSSLWFFGLKPDYEDIQLLPMFASQLKLLIHGTVRLIVVDTEKRTQTEETKNKHILVEQQNKRLMSCLLWTLSPPNSALLRALRQTS